MICKGPGKVGITATEIPGFLIDRSPSTGRIERCAQERGFSAEISANGDLYCWKK